MSELNLNIEKVLAELSKEILSGNQVSDIFDNPKEFPTQLIEKLALETALRYWTEQINYEEGDFIMNNIYAFWITNEYYSKNYGFGDIAWECFEAFDAGEDYRGDDTSIDPALTYTRPLIEKLLRKQKQIV